jgi:hopanoid biosynthesis associated protein HpnK
VTADDFGASLEVNEAVELAHRQGILTAASLMVGAPVAADAVERARRLPGLGVGLHIVLVCGRPMLDPSVVPTLVGRGGQFLDNLVEAGIKFFFSPNARRELEAEIRAQFEAFKATGLELDHVNAHNHMHIHPTVMGLIIKVGRDYGLRAVRLPRQPSETGGIPSFFLSGWIALLQRKLERHRVRHNDFMFGLDETGHLNAACLAKILKRVPAGVSEIYCHPATVREGQPFPDDYRPDEELAALLNKDIAALVDSGNIRRINFSELARA